jgi:hypothetical protein
MKIIKDITYFPNGEYKSIQLYKPIENKMEYDKFIIEIEENRKK